MKKFEFLPEGWEKDFAKNTKDIYQGIVEKCDDNYNLHVKLDDGTIGIIPREEIEAINIEKDGLPKTNICLGKVHKYVQFKIKDNNSENMIFSRKQVQNEALQYIKTHMNVGEKVNGIVKNITPYGAFIEIGGGIVGLAHIEDLSVARIKSPYERLKIGQKVNVMVKYIDRSSGKINLSYKELFGTWEENAEKYEAGMKAKGIVRETEKNKNGIFIELSPNLVGMAEYEEGLNYGEQVDVYIKKIDYDKKKVKLVLIK